MNDFERTWANVPEYLRPKKTKADRQRESAAALQAQLNKPPEDTPSREPQIDQFVEQVMLILHPYARFDDQDYVGAQRALEEALRNGELSWVIP